MKKSFLFLLLASLAMVGCKNEGPTQEYNPGGYDFPIHEERKATVSFLYNFNKQEFNLNSGLYATGNSIALKVDSVDKGSKIVKPDIDPIRKDYSFDGWHKQPSVSSPWDFENEVVQSNLVLYAHWKQEEIKPFIEPEYVEPSKIDDTISTFVEVTSVLNMPIVSKEVKLTTASIARLTKDKTDVTACLGYKIKTGVTLTATYDPNTYVISYHAEKDGVTQDDTVLAKLTSYPVNNSTYEQKAKNYEGKAENITDHRIMLAGSSSMENWSTSTEDLDPLTTFNHGIGGTTVDEWKDKLNYRLVYPFSPKTVVYYVGVNNIINTGDDGATTANYLIAMFDDVHAHLPNTKIYYVLINSLPNYQAQLPQMEIVNNAAKNYEAKHDYVTCLDAGQTLLKDDGTPNSAFFLTDGLHMSKYGYVLWGNFIKNKLIEDMSE